MKIKQIVAAKIVFIIAIQNGTVHATLKKDQYIKENFLTWEKRLKGFCKIVLTYVKKKIYLSPAVAGFIRFVQNKNQIIFRKKNFFFM